jgi:uncharacterized protein YyaL (SSP411 family)
MANRLEHASSAYLKSAAHQPIDWHEFGEEAFQLAKELDRPVLLDIGAVWCHWCHVIDRESYDNPEIAEIINQYYVPIKVDRDQRPDVDARYQQVVQALSGQGGWPLTAFLTYDGRLIYGGTYFPPETMKSLLLRIQDIYRERKADIFREGDVLTEDALRAKENAEREVSGKQAPVEAVSPEGLNKLCKDFLDVMRDAVQRSYDPVHGGFGTQPKFPHYSTLEWMIAHLYTHPEAHAMRTMLEKTLTEMARGGIYDQIAGGFHRYSVDDHWHVPHFEKMAYDNAEAIVVYSQAYRLTGIPFFKEVAENIINWVNELLSDQQHGGFYASQDADIDLNDDGDHFTWSPQELQEILTTEECEIVRRYYNVHERGDMHHAPGRNVLMVSRPTTEIAHELSLPIGQVESDLASAREKMLAKRRQRPMPFVDKTLYVNWNGMLIAAYFEAADLLDLPEARTFAEKSLERMLSDFYKKGQQVFHTTGIDGFLEDYAWLAWAALKGYASVANPYYLQVARDIAEMLIGRFEDERLGGFFDLPKANQALALLQFKRKPVEDSPSSSANAVALRVLQALSLITDDPLYEESLMRGLNILIHQHGHFGLFVSALALVAHYQAHLPLKLEVTGPQKELQFASRKVFYPGKVLHYSPGEAVSEVRICVGTRCLPPENSPEALAGQIKTLVPAAIGCMPT